jgi:hypothetical protein
MPSISNILPNMIYAGTQRTGSTWLYHSLKEHPEVYVPYVKEIHYFDRHLNKGIRWYSSFFQGASNEPIRADITPNYFHDTSIPPLIKETIPAIKVILVLRHPVQFLFSLYRHHRQTLQVDRDFESVATDAEYQSQARYAHKVRAYLASFPREQIHVGIYEELISSPTMFLFEIYSFLGINYYAPSSIHEKANRAIEPRYKTIHRLLRLLRRASRSSESAHSLTGFLRDYILHSPFYSRPAPSGVNLHSKVARYLENVLLDDVSQLSELLGIDFISYWGFPSG